ncbi:MAG: FAD-dependent oxidoreductase [Anaerolineae bacterium]|nr:FAD-dependent oxidoreductase [Anaerolineae bacterium]
MRDDVTQQEKVVGAAMVVGGGIAGIQASLDLAEAGFKVYLVELQSAIGGHMAQLDKTFPTNDCSMCIISPKLVETGRHRNVELLVDSEVIGVRGEAGNFSVRLRTRPRYIDLDRCTGCGECAEACPVVIPNYFDQGLADQRAVYKLYPQAVPNAYAIEKLGIAPCRDACPTGQRVQGYIALIREGRYHDALRVIKEDNPFPGICGRICNHRCEDACNRRKLDEAINIRALKRFVTDTVYAEPRMPPQPAERKYAERVAVIGAGPCGLTAAQDLCQLGYGVAVFEALPVAGGMLRVGVPEYRLPASIVDREVQDIVDLGVELRLNTFVDNLDDIFDEGFHAVLIAVGAHEGIRPPIPGADLNGVLINTTFLRDVRLGNLPSLGERVAVVGAGDVAMDVARTAVRMGAEVHVYYRRTRGEATAGAEELRHAEEEGVNFHFQTTPIEIVGDEERCVVGMKCVRTEQGLVDETGRSRPVQLPGSEHFVPCDTVIFSIGQRAGLAFIPESAGVGITGQATIAVNPNTLAATRSGVFAAGDATTGTSFVIEAVAAGHRAAESIDRYLQGKEMEPPPKPQLPVVELNRLEIEERVKSGQVCVQPRVPMDELPVDQRSQTFEEVVAGYTHEQAQAEAARCLACGICSECLSCVYACQAEAIDHDMVEQVQDLNVGAILLAPGFAPYDAARSEEYGWGRYANVVTSLQFERLLSASGPTHGHVRRPSDGATPRRIAFLQCVGSRDQEHNYCSSVCCMYATKEAILACEHEPDTRISVFMMDMRSFSKGYEEYYRRARERYGVRYIRSRVSAIVEDPQSRDLRIRYVDEENAAAPIVEETFDMVVLAVGMEIPEAVRDLGRRLGIELDGNGFCRTLPFAPLQTSRPGIYALGPFREPKDIPESVVEASGAAGVAGALLAPARWTLADVPPDIPERDVTGEEPRIGVFVCHCGSNIAGALDVPKVAEYAATLPGVVHAESNLYTCSQDTVAHITEVTREQGLNRVVVASCSPLTHEPLFQDAIREAGLNPNLFEMANIRNQCSWVHPDNWDVATEKAQDLVRMAVAKAAQLEPLYKTTVKVEKAALIVGGGAAGMTAALTLAQQGFPVHLVERENRLGGNLLQLRHYLQEATGEGERIWLDPQAYAQELVRQVEAEPLVTVHLNTHLVDTGGFLGHFTSRLQGPDGELEISHGAAIIATGGQEYRGPEYGYGSDSRIVTQQEFEHLLSARQDLPDSVAMIQCVGPAEAFCSRICCTTALKNALMLKRHKPEAQVVVLYRDVRTFGFKERVYQEARRAGVLFVRFEFDRKPEVQIGDDGLRVAVWEHSLGQEVILRPDMLVLSMPVVPSEGAQELASRLRIPVDLDGFFLEAHVKLRPVDFSSDGFFLAGMAHYPKFLDEAVAQAQAAAARAATILSRDELEVGGIVAQVDEERCVGCLTCVRICPYHAPRVQADLPGVGSIMGAAYIEPAQCHGCGICVAECPAKAIQLLHYRSEQMEAKIAALMLPSPICS